MEATDHPAPQKAIKFRRLSYVRVMFGILNQVIEASWADNLQGVNGRTISNRDIGKREWVLGKLRELAQ